MIKNLTFLKVAQQRDFIFDIWRPVDPMIILGRSSVEKTEIKKNVYENKIEILRRLGGGGAVYLDSNVLIIDVAIGSIKNKTINDFVLFCNSIIIAVLLEFSVSANQNPENFDIVVENKKLAGISIYKHGQSILYGASIILKNDVIKNIEKYLNEPQKQPIYRKKRRHIDFLSSVEQLGIKNESLFIEKLIYNFENKEFS